MRSHCRLQSVDPYLRGRIKTGGSCKPGQTMEGFVAGKVVPSVSCRGFTF